MSKPTPINRYKPSLRLQDEMAKDVAASIMSKLMRKADAASIEPDNSNVLPFPIGKIAAPEQCVYRINLASAVKGSKCPCFDLYDHNRALLVRALKNPAS